MVRRHPHGWFENGGEFDMMPSDTPDHARSTAINQLKALGLSTYAARTFVALVGLGVGTAQDVSDVADVPRTRVYDAIDELRDRGLVDVNQSTPMEFWAISTETTGRHFDQEYNQRVHTLVEALDSIEPVRPTTEQRGVWTVTGRETISERIKEFIDAAETEVVYMTADELLTEDIVASLSDASERGVAIQLAEMSMPAEDHLDDRVPSAEVFESLWDWSDTPAGRMLVADQNKTLVSVLVEPENQPVDPRDETAIWGEGEANSLVVVLRTMFAWQLDGERD